MLEPQVRLLSSVPRAVFEAFLRMAPGGWGFCPPLWAAAAPGRSARSYGTATKEPGDAIRGAGTMQLQPPRVGCACCTRARPPRAGPA